MDAIISHAYGFSGIMLIILITYAAIYFLKISGKKRVERTAPHVKCEETSKRGRNAGRAIRSVSYTHLVHISEYFLHVQESIDY